MLKKYSLNDGKLLESQSDDSLVLVYVNPDDKDKSYLVSQLLIDEHTLHSSLDEEELGRLEFEANHLAVIIKKPKSYKADNNFLFKVSSLGLFLFADKLVIVSTEELSLEGRRFSKLKSVQDVFLKIVFDSILHFEDHLKVIHKIADELELEINKAVSNKDLFHMFKLEKSLVYYLNAINSNNKVIEKLKTNAAKIGFSQEVNELLEDVIIENTQCYEQANTYSEVLSSMMDAWASIINNNLNIRIKTLTILSLCIMTPTLIVSLFSMNVSMPFTPSQGLMPFYFILSIALLAVLGIFLISRYRKW